MHFYDPINLMKPASATIPELSTCGLQICSHPKCWEGTKRFERELHQNKPLPKISKKSRFKEDKVIYEERDNTFDGIPVMTIVNMLDDYGYSEQERLSSASSDRNQSKRFPTPDLPADGFELITKLQLQSLNNEVSNGITPAPANTPLQSSHGFADGSHPSEDSNSQDPVYLPNKRVPPHSVYRILPHSINNMKLDARKLQPKKVYVWKANNSSAQRRILPNPQDISDKKPTPASNIILPVDILPEKINESQWRKKKLKKSTKTQTIGLQSLSFDHPFRKLGKDGKPLKFSSFKSSDANTAEALSALHAIEKLRHVSVEVLLRVIKMALRNKVLSSQQAILLLRQVTGQTYAVPAALPDKDEKEADSSSSLLPKTISVCQPSAACPDKLASKTTPLSVYKLDIQPAVAEIKRKLPPNSTQPIQEKKKPDGIVQNTPERVIRPILKSRVGLIGPSTDDVVVRTPPARPFHYLKNSQDMGLHPIPTPPPSSPSTERDSQYNEVFGGSTMVVNLSNPMSPCTERRLSGGSLLSWRKSLTSNGNQTDRKAPSSSKSTMWPQVDENDYMATGGEFPDSSEDFMDFHNRGIPEGVDVKLPALQETAASGVETTESEEASPVPPPPSPELHQMINKISGKEENAETVKPIS